MADPYPAAVTSDQQDLNARIRTLRVDRSLSQERLGELSGLGSTTIGSLERGTRFPRRATLEAIARALELPVGEIFAHSGVNESAIELSPALRELVPILNHQPDPIVHLVVKLAGVVVSEQLGDAGAAGGRSRGRGRAESKSPTD